MLAALTGCWTRQYEMHSHFWERLKMWRWGKRIVGAAVALMAAMIILGSMIGPRPDRPPLPRIAEAPPPKPLLTGTLAKVTRYTIGCSSQADYEALADIAITMGSDAYSQSAQQYLMTGRCRAFNAGQDVQIAGVAVIAELRAIRPKGEASSYWTTETALTASEIERPAASVAAGLPPAPPDVAASDSPKLPPNWEEEEGLSLEARISRNAMGCSSQRHYEELMALSVKDRAASEKQRKWLFEVGICRTLKVGQYVTIIRDAPFAGLYGVQATGEVENYWVSRKDVNRLPR